MALPENPINRHETYLAKIAGQAVEVPEYPITREEAYLDEIAKNGAGGGGTKDYEELTHKPSIGGVVLSGDKSLSDLGAASEEAVAAKASQSDIAPTFSDATAYTAGDVVYYEGSLYRFTADHSAGAWDSADVEPVTVDDLVDGLKPVDSITDGDMRPVTSNAVYDAISIRPRVKKHVITIPSVTAGTSVVLGSVYDLTDGAVSYYVNLFGVVKNSISGTAAYDPDGSLYASQSNNIVYAPKVTQSNVFVSFSILY
jgi:hypothetical protein